jgi:broad specificity phosphatase PhoE
VIAFVRHGETPPNRDGLLLGRSDVDLTSRGADQAAALGVALHSLAPAVVVSSPLARAVRTASAISEACGIDRVEIDDRLIEVAYGEYEGLSFADIPADAVARWRADANFAPPGGESLRTVGKRMAEFCEEHLDERMVIAVSHVSPIKAAVTWTLGVGEELAWRMRLEVASVTRIGPGPVLLSFNERPASLHP